MNKKIKLFTLLIGTISVAATSIGVSSCSYNLELSNFCDKLRIQKNPSGIEKSLKFFSDQTKNYSIFTHNDTLSAMIKDSYSKNEIENIKNITKQVWDYSSEIIKNNQGTFIPTAKISSSSASSYGAIWVRDTVWNILALKSQDNTKALEVAKSIIKYFHTTKQMDRMNNVINNPNILKWPDGAQNAVHIRFDCNSPTLDDVYIDGVEEKWTHKQNDALGLFMYMVLDYYDQLLEEQEKSETIDVLATMTSYLNRAEYWNMEDSGSWEEIEKLSCSSVGCVVSGLERLEDKIQNDIQFKDAYNEKIAALGIEQYASESEIHKIIKSGYATINASIDNGGESISYNKDDKRYREADASMLHLIYPLNLKQLTIERKLKILNIVETLNTPFGIKRYQNDNYQCNNFWFSNIQTDSEESTYKKREELFVKGAEASWFFDSWIASCYASIYNKIEDSKKMQTKDLLFYHVNKALAFITSNLYYRADGSKIETPSLSESYNVIIDVKDKNKWYYVASPIDPLHWAQSSFYLMLNEISNILI